jgi:hypothetical protein
MKYYDEGFRVSCHIACRELNNEGPEGEGDIPIRGVDLRRIEKAHSLSWFVILDSSVLRLIWRRVAVLTFESKGRGPETVIHPSQTCFFARRKSAHTTTLRQI